MKYSASSPGHPGNSLRRIAARFVGLFNHEGLIAPGVQIGVVALRLILDMHERGRKTRDLPLLGDHQRDRLSVEEDFVVVERTKRRALGRDVVVIALVGAGHFRPVLAGQHVDHAFDGQRPAGVDALDATLRDGRGDDVAINQIGSREFGRVLGRAGDLGAAIDAGGGCADVCCHGG